MTMKCNSLCDVAEKNEKMFIFTVSSRGDLKSYIGRAGRDWGCGEFGGVLIYSVTLCADKGTLSLG